MPDIRLELREIVAELSQRFAYVAALVTVERKSSAAVDAGERSHSHMLDAGLVLTVEHGARVYEQVTTDLSRQGILNAAEALRVRTTSEYQAIGSRLPLAAPREFATEMRMDPRWMGPGDWTERAGGLYERARLVGGSRIVYRGAYLTVNDCETLYIGNGRDLLQRVVRARAGAVFVAKESSYFGEATTGRGPDPVIDVAEVAGAAGVEITEIPTTVLEQAAERVLSIVSPLAPPHGELDVVLDPSVAALIFRAVVAQALSADAWIRSDSRARALAGQAVAAPFLTVIDDPTVPGGFGSYFFDDEGEAALPTSLIEGGVLRAPLTSRRTASLLGVERTGNGRRLVANGHGHGRVDVAPWPSNVIVAPGERDRLALIGDVTCGLFIEGGVWARVNPHTLELTVQAARAHEIIGGKTTGVLYGGVLLRAAVPALLKAVRGLSKHVGSLADPANLAAAVMTPHILTRAEVLGAGRPLSCRSRA